MYMFESSPRKGAIHVLTIGCFVAALSLFAVAGLEGMPYPVLYQFSAVLLLTIGVYFLVRYALKMYQYEIASSGITDAEGNSQKELIITELSGNRRRVVTRVLVRDIARVALIDAKKEKAEEAAFVCDVKKIFKYVNTPLPGKGLYILVPEEDSVVVIPPDEKMTKLLKQMTTIDE